MFNREFRTAEHRQHMRPPTSPGYTFEAVGTPGRTASRIDTLRSIVQNGQHEEVDGMVVDLQTANLLVQIYDKGNDNTKNLVETAPLEKVVGAAWKLTSGRTAVSLDAFEQEGYDAWHRDEPAAPAANKMVMDALEGASVGDRSNIEIMKAFSRGFERGRQEMMDREFPEMRGASRTADRWLLDDLADMAGMTAPLGNGWEVLHTNGGGSVLFREFSDYDSGSVAPPAVPGDPWNWSVHARLYQVQVGSGSANTAEEAMRMVEETYAAYKTASRKQAAEGDEVDLTYEQAKEILSDPSHDAYGKVRLYGIIGEGETAGQIIGIKSLQNLDRFAYDRIYTIERSGVPIFRARKQGSRRTAFLDSLELPETRHRVAGWDWDDHLNGFIAAEAAREFTCSCGSNIPAPGYTDCRCGKRWNAYTVSANGSKKMIAREVPVRQNVVMARTARRKTAAGWSKGTHPDISGLSDEQLQDFIDNVQESIDAGANVGEIMKNKRDRFEEELRSRGRKATRKQAASSPSEVISQHFSGWQVDDDDGDFWEIQSPGREHAFIHEGGDVYTVLINDGSSREVWETGLTFDEALEEFRSEGVI